MPSTVISYPISAYQNVPIHAEYYKPSQFFITAISTGLNTTVTTSVNNNYVIGQECRLLIPNGYGSTQLNEVTGFVIDIPSPNQVTLDIESLKVNAFINASLRQKPQIVAIGDVNTGQINTRVANSNLTNIPGSFINISP